MKKVLLLICALTLAPFAAKAETGVTKMSVSGPLMVLDGDAFWGLNFGAFHGVTDQLDVGGETGFFYHSSNGVKSWIIPVVPTALYHFDIGAPTFMPFGGLGLGVAINHVSVPVLGNRVSNTDVDFHGLLHIGAKMGQTQRFFGDIKLGLLDGDFVFVPSVGWFF